MSINYDEMLSSALTDCRMTHRIAMLVEANRQECIDLCVKGDVNNESQIIDLVCEWFRVKCSSSFASAYDDYGKGSGLSKIEFFIGPWNDDIEFSDISLKRSDLYRLCESDRFLSRVNDVSANEFVLGVVSEEAYTALKEVLTECQQSKQYFDSLPHAGSVVQGLYGEELNKLFKKIIEGFKDRCFLGSGFLKFDFSCIDATVLQLLREELTRNNFTINGDVIFAKKGVSSQKFEDESSIAELNSKNGFDYWEAAHSVRCKIIPEFLNREVKILSRALENVRVKDKFIELAKEDTKTNAYLLLFEDLQSKGFRVEDLGLCYRVYWW